jgi:hypothetical protein
MTVAASLMMLAPVSQAAVRGMVRGIPAGSWHGTYWAPYGYGYYDPFWSYGYGYPGYGYAYDNTGAVKIETKSKTADVFINGSFAGSTADTKTFHLAPGNYNVEVREQGRTQFSQQVYVTARKTLHVRPAEAQ